LFQFGRIIRAVSSASGITITSIFRNAPKPERDCNRALLNQIFKPLQAETAHRVKLGKSDTLRLVVDELRAE